MARKPALPCTTSAREVRHYAVETWKDDRAPAAPGWIGTTACGLLAMSEGRANWEVRRRRSSRQEVELATLRVCRACKNNMGWRNYHAVDPT